MGGSGGGGSGKIDYPDYMETAHKQYMDHISLEVESIEDRRHSPYLNYDQKLLEDDIYTSFFGTGLTIATFGKLSDSFDALVETDLDQSYSYTLDDTVNNDYVKNSINIEAARMSDDLENNVMPRILIGARDIGSVNSSTFIMAKAKMEQERIKELNKFSSNLKVKLIPAALDRWKTGLEWKKQILIMHAELIKFYLAAQIDSRSLDYDMLLQHQLWPFTVNEYRRASISSITGGVSSSSTTQSVGRRALGGALSGAALGAQIGGPIGAAIGAYTGASLATVEERPLSILSIAGFFIN